MILRNLRRSHFVFRNPRFLFGSRAARVYVFIAQCVGAVNERFREAAQQNMTAPRCFLFAGWPRRPNGPACVSE